MVIRLTKIMRDKGLLDFPNQMDESKKDLIRCVKN